MSFVLGQRLTLKFLLCRATWTPTDSATKSGRSLSRTSTSSWTTRVLFSLIK